MPGPTVLMHAAAWSQLLPVGAAVHRRFERPAFKWLATGFLVSVAGDALQLWLGRRGLNNLWVSYLSTPVMGASFLWAMSYFHTGLVGRLALRIAVPVYVMVWYALAILVEDTAGFSRFVYPLHSLLILAAGLWILTSRGVAPARQPILRSDWFWIVGGLSLYGAGTAIMEPVLVELMKEDVGLVVAAYQVRSASDILAFVAISWGMLCSARIPRSGPSFSPPASG